MKGFEWAKGIVSVLSFLPLSLLSSNAITTRSASPGMLRAPLNTGGGEDTRGAREMCLLPHDADFALLLESQQRRMSGDVKLCVSHHISSGSEPAWWVLGFIGDQGERAQLKEVSSSKEDGPCSLPIPRHHSPGIFYPSSSASCIPQIHSPVVAGNGNSDMSRGDHRHPNGWGMEATTASAGFPVTTAHLLPKREIQDPATVCDFPKVAQWGQLSCAPDCPGVPRSHFHHFHPCEIRAWTKWPL